MTMQRFVVTAVLLLALLAPGMTLDEPVAQPIPAESQASSGSMPIVENVSQMFTASPQDGGWASGFDPPGMNWPVYALATGPDGAIYAGGDFTSAGGILANYVARWDGATSSWHSLASGMGGGTLEHSPVYALAVGPDGSLYAGGNFTIAGGVAANNIARWDAATSSWHPLGSGVSSPVVTLAIGPDGSLYAGGVFTMAGGVVANGIARWDGAQWYPLGVGMGGDYPRVDALAVGPDGSLYAGGYFATAGGVAANHIARWDGAQWHPLGSGMGDYGAVRALAIAPDGSLYAGGGFAIAGGVAANNVARWDGTAWHALDTGTSATVWAVAVGLDGALYAGGCFISAGDTVVHHIARWDGAAWHALGSGMNPYGSVSSLVVNPDGSLYAGGEFSKAGSAPAYFISRWDTLASTWHPLPSGNGMGGMVSALAVDPGRSLYAGGHFASADGVLVNNVARWDPLSSTWHPLGDGITGMDYDDVEALAFGSDGVLYAGGWFNFAGGLTAKHIAFWNPQTLSWHTLGSGVDTLYGYEPPEVRALAVATDGSLYVGGSFDTAGGIGANNIARWDPASSSWHPLGSGTNGFVRTLAIGADGSLYAGGGFTSAGGVAANYIARWDETTSSWYPLGSGMGGGYHGISTVCTLAVGPDDSLYAGGWFTTAGGVVANRIALWDGTKWEPVGRGVGGTDYSAVYSLEFGHNDLLYVGGRFVTAGEVMANNIAYWDERESSWHALARGMDDSVYSLTINQDGSLYVGGMFTSASGVPSGYIAHWGEPAPSSVSLDFFSAEGNEQTGDWVLSHVILTGLALLAVTLLVRYRGPSHLARREGHPWSRND